MGYKTAVQVLKQADDLKAKVSKKCDWLNNAEVWTNQQKLQTIYHQVLVLDLEYALDKKVEQDLWNIGFKNHISSLQEQARDKKNPNRTDYQALLTWALEAASGFYITLLQELCNTFDIDLPFRKRPSAYGQTIQTSDLIDLPQTSSCIYICQYCLVHLGDIARYRNQRKQAESFYKQAILVSPTSGQPYNQLALLEASQGNKLSTVFYYIRGISVKNPFPASATNLSSTLSSAIDKDSPTEKIQTKLTVSEFVQLFLRTHGYFHLCTDLKQAETTVKSLNSIMTALVATQSFTKEMLIKMSIINLYALNHIGAGPKKVSELTNDEKKVRELILELLAGTLCAFLVPVHTLKADDSLLDYYALPAVKFLLYFIQNEPELLKEKVFTNKLQMWPSLVKLVNNSQKYLRGINFNKYSKYPLPEDKYLQGFLPLSKNFNEFDFKEDIEDSKIERLVRMKRLVNFSLWLTDIDVNGSKFIIKKETNGDVTFESGSIQPDPTNELLEEMKSFNVVDNSETAKKKNLEKKAGILKPQGSLEKSREERELSLNNNEMPTDSLNITTVNNKIDKNKNKRGQQNIALQSIFKKMEENKQVKFLDEPEKEKLVKFDSLQTSSPKNPSTTQNQQFNMSLRNPPFNQNSSNYPIAPTHQSDFLTALRNVPNMQMDKGPNYQFPKTETMPQNVAPMGLPMMSPYQTVQPPQNKMPQKPPPVYQSNQKPFTNNQQGAPYQNISLPPSHPFNTWNRDDVPPPQARTNPTWWPNMNQPPPTGPPQQQVQNYRPENYSMHFPPYSHFVAPQSNPMMSKHDFTKPNNSQGGGDIFNSPWSNFSVNFVGDNSSMGFSNNNQGMSMRQAMLKEAMPSSPVGPPGPPSSSIRRIPNPQPLQENNFTQNPTSTPGYSLFNANSWTPNLAGQLRNNVQSENSTNHIQQQSLFSGHGPKSLAQLLEQQSQLNKKTL